MALYMWAADDTKCYPVVGNAAVITFQAGGACATDSTVVFPSNGKHTVAVQGATFDKVVSDQGDARKDGELDIPKPPPEGPDMDGPAGMHVLLAVGEKTLYISAAAPAAPGQHQGGGHPGGPAPMH